MYFSHGGAELPNLRSIGSGYSTIYLEAIMCFSKFLATFYQIDLKSLYGYDNQY